MAAQMKGVTKTDLLKLLEKLPDDDYTIIGYLMGVQDGVNGSTHQVLMLYDSLTGTIC